ncbi:DUF1905 domain-containing protein [Modestobacter versicolor]|uniref:DUF1905 domain-containing protein n=1 Tax=Modestobacter versicolor TaxID=429133 RepID=UPI0034DFA6B7
MPTDRAGDLGLQLEFTGDVWHWRGPAPFHFVTVPPEESARLAEVAPALSYGWGMLPVRARIGGTAWTTSLWPKDGAYLLPLKDAVRRAEQLDVGDVVTAHLTPGR